MISRRTFLVSALGAACNVSAAPVLLRSTLLGKSFSPVPSPQMWLKRGSGLFTDAGVTPAAPGGLVYQWNDQSGNGYHVTQSTSGLRPLMAADGSLYFPGFVYGGGTLDTKQMVLDANLSVNARAFTLFAVSHLNANSYACSLFQSSNLNPGLLSNENTGGPGWGNFCLWGSSLQQSGFKQTAVKNVQVLVGRSTSADLHLNELKATKTTLPSAINTGGKFANWNDFRYWIGTISEFLLYSSALSDTQISEVKGWLYARHGIISADPAEQIVFDGDSLTFGYFAEDASTYPAQVAKSLPAGWRVLNYAKPGFKITDLNTNAATVVDSVYSAGYSKNICVLWCGCNDLNSSVSPATVFSNLQTYGNARKTAGWQVVVLTMLPRSSTNVNYEADRQTLNTSIRGDTSWYDALADVGNDGTIGQSGQNTNSTYYQSDNTHLKASGLGIVAATVKEAVDTL